MKVRLNSVEELLDIEHDGVTAIIVRLSEQFATAYYRFPEAELSFELVFGSRPVVYSNNMFCVGGDIISEYGNMLVIYNGRLIRFRGGDCTFMTVGC